jgi:hypothetical protein
MNLDFVLQISAKDVLQAAISVLNKKSHRGVEPLSGAFQLM